MVKNFILVLRNAPASQGWPEPGSASSRCFRYHQHRRARRRCRSVSPRSPENVQSANWFAVHESPISLLPLSDRQFLPFFYTCDVEVRTYEFDLRRLQEVKRNPVILK